MASSCQAKKSFKLGLIWDEDSPNREYTVYGIKIVSPEYTVQWEGWLLVRIFLDLDIIR